MDVKTEEQVCTAVHRQHCQDVGVNPHRGEGDSQMQSPIRSCSQTLPRLPPANRPSAVPREQSQSLGAWALVAVLGSVFQGEAEEEDPVCPAARPQHHYPCGPGPAQRSSESISRERWAGFINAK